MDKASAQRKAVFAAIVVALAALGIYMFMPGALGAGRSRQTARDGAPCGHPAGPATPAPASPAPAPASAARRRAPDIYRWLPFTQAELTSAARVVTEFSGAYGT